MNQLYKTLSITKQSFHQMLRRREKHLDELEQALLMVNRIRKDHPCMSVRKIYFKLNLQGIGRDRFEQFCFERGYRVKKKKNYRVTTDSRGVTRFPNLIREIEVTGVNQVLVSDITYYEMLGRFYYITLIMDLFSREIVGFSVSKSLRTEETTLPALKMVKRKHEPAALKGCIIHSDGGGQYYNKEFRKLTKQLGMRNSMTEEDVYENAHAERLNGVIKNDYLYAYCPEIFQKLKMELKRAVNNYNHGKPHEALKKMTPVEFRKAAAAGFENSVASYFPIPVDQNHENTTASIKENNKTIIFI